MKYKTLHHQAKYIDHLIDHTLRSRSSVFLTREELRRLILQHLANLYVVDYGWHKIVFGIRSIDHRIVLKVGRKKTIEDDHRAYKRVPDSVRHQLFARMFWHTKYCLLQEYGFPVNVTPQELAQLRRDVYKYGIIDVKPENLKRIDGKLKIIDANVTRIPLPVMMRKIDETKQRLPKKLTKAMARISTLTHAKE